MEYTELSLINACITHGKAYEVVSKVGGDDFSPQRRPIFATIKALCDEGSDPDLLTVAERMEAAGYEDVFDDLTQSAEFVTLGNIETQCKELKRNALSRKLKEAATTIARLAQDQDPETAYEQACNALNSLRAGDADDSLHAMNQILMGYMEDLERRFESDDVFDGLTTGYDEVDNRWMGLKPQNLIVVAGRPAMGKTTFGLNCVEHSVRQGNSWLVFSMEMSSDELAGKLISSAGHVPYSRLQNADLDGEDWPKLTSGVTLLKDGLLHVDERGGITVADMRARAYEILGKTGNLDGIMADYIQLMTGEGQSRENQIGSISRALKGLAKEFNIPVIAISQLNRKCEERPNKRPILSDLRDSGSIEQDANIVSFVYRDDVYNEDSPVKGVAEIITAKYRGGKIGTDCLAWRGEYQRFDNLEYRPDVESVAEQQEQAKSRGPDRSF